uniref:Slc26a-8 n=1 Tax=Schmidtea mediterranea TaxID=79327 RepID=A0A0H3YFH1_SCHMD|nr:slc26a-8 [Schmidtea mediterranea]
MDEFKDSTDVGFLLEGSDLHINKTSVNVISIKRPIYTQHEFDLNHGGNYIKKSWKRKFMSKVRSTKKEYVNKQGMKRCIREKLPFISIMMKYKWREWLLADFIAGLIVGIMHIPQSMAYAHLAGLKPIYGLYGSFFPVIVYFFFGTSRHISIGTIAIISLLTGKFLEKSLLDFPIKIANNSLTFLANENISFLSSNDSLRLSQETSKITELLKANRVAGFAFLVGVVQLIMGIFNLGFLTKYLSDPLISGFTVGASMHVFTSQIKYCFGLNIPKQFGVFNIAKTYFYIAKNLPKTNIPTLVLTVVVIIVLFVTKEWINPRVVKKIRVPIPMELIVVIIGTVVSKYLLLNENHKVRIVGEISQGLPAPSLPDLNNFSMYVADIFITAIIAFSVGISLAKLFSKKHGYEIDTNQELIAYGIMNFVASFFLCYPSASSLSRSAVQESVGGKTQLTSLVSSFLLLFVLLFIGPVFHTLPNCILSAIIIVALKGMFMQFAELKELWLFSIWDFSTWVVAFLGTAFIDVEYGLMIGIGFSILMIMLRTQNPKSHILGQIKGTDLYKNVEVYNEFMESNCNCHFTCEEIDGIKIFRYEGSLYYACSDNFKSSLYNKISYNPRLIKLRILKLERKLKKLKQHNNNFENSPFFEEKTQLETELEKLKHPIIHHLIIDCSTWGYIDYVGVKTLNQVIEEYKSINITVLLANPKTDVRATIFRNDASSIIDDRIIFVSVHDAVINSVYERKMENVNSNGTYHNSEPNDEC